MSFRDFWSRIGCIFATMRDTVYPSREARLKEIARKLDIQIARNVMNRASFFRFRKHAVDNDGMPLLQNSRCPLDEYIIDLVRKIWPICVLGKPVKFTDAKQLLSKNIRTQYDCSWIRHTAA